MNMYIGRAKGGAFEIVKSLGAIDPREQVARPRDADAASASDKGAVWRSRPDEEFTSWPNKRLF